MKVILLRLDEKRYQIGLRRDGRHDIGPDVPLRSGPGGGPLPHDLVHFAVEDALGIRLGIFGQLAAGGDCGGFFFPAPEDRSKVADTKRSKRVGRAGREDATRSEQIAALVGHDAHVRENPDLLTPDEHRRVEARVAELGRRWRATEPGAALVLEWPSRKLRL